MATKSYRRTGRDTSGQVTFDQKMSHRMRAPRGVTDRDTTPLGGGHVSRPVTLGEEGLESRCKIARAQGIGYAMPPTASDLWAVVRKCGETRNGRALSRFWKRWGHLWTARLWPIRCGAKRKRDGLPCQGRAVTGRLRCKFHGGMSTGPRSFKRQAFGVAAMHGGFAKRDPLI